MLRRLRGVLLVVLLTVLVALAILWIRSYYQYDLAGRDGLRSAAVGSYRGHLLLFYWRNDQPRSEASWGRLTGPIAEAESTWQNIQQAALFSVLGFGFFYSPQSQDWHSVMFVPDWFVMIVMGWPAFRLAQSRLRTRRRRRRGLCLQCGYDLHATPQRCPECGTPTDRQICC